MSQIPIKSLLGQLLMVLLSLTMLSCTKSGGDDASSTTVVSNPDGSSANYFATSSSSGDYGFWTLESSGSFSGKWDVYDGTTDIVKSYLVTATCGSIDETHGYQTCTVQTSKCFGGIQTCGTSDSPAVGSTFQVLKKDGTAVAIAIQDGQSTHVLHAGVDVDRTCPTSDDETEDYNMSFIGYRQSTMFSIVRATSQFGTVWENTYTTKNHACASHTASSECTVNALLVVSSGDRSAQESTYSCSDGVFSANFGNQFVIGARSTNGMLMLFYPKRSGGFIGYPRSKAPRDIDFHRVVGGTNGRTLKSVYIGDDGSQPSFFDVTIEKKLLLVNNNGLITSVPFFGYAGENNGTLKTAEGSTTAATFPGFPNFTLSPIFSSADVIQDVVGQYKDIRGLGYIDGTRTDTSNRRHLATISTLDDKGVGFITTFDWRNRSGDSSPDYENTGFLFMIEQ